MTCDCIIPFFNEGDRVYDLLLEMHHSKQISQIICVDDGSTESSTYYTLKKEFPKAKIVRFTKNLGRAEAIKAGLDISNSDYVLIMDADLQNVNVQEFDSNIQKLFEYSDIDMLILRRINGVLFHKLIRTDYIFVERIVRRTLLNDIFKQKLKNFQIDSALNQYMIDHHKKVYWLPSTATSVSKTTKYGLVKGFYLDTKMTFEIWSYVGLPNYFRQRIFFGHDQLA